MSRLRHFGRCHLALLLVFTTLSWNSAYGSGTAVLPAGFALLDPHRQAALSATAATLAWQHWRHRSVGVTVASLAVVAVLTALPAAVEAVGRAGGVWAAVGAVVALASSFGGKPS